jgi:hypothetical protein
MPFLIDGLLILLIGLGVYAEMRRGLFFALFDIFRLFAAIVIGFAAYSAFHRLFHSYAAGLIALGIAALTAVMVVPIVLKLLKADPAWGRTFPGRLGAGLIGIAIGFVTVAAFLPVIGRAGRGRDAVSRSFLAQPFIDAAPGLYYVADAFNLDFPVLNSRAIRFEYEGKEGEPALIERVNYSRLNGSTCIECGANVHFDGYFNRIGSSISPRFTCPNCGRTSDGCQTFQGFHRMYGLCPVQVSESLGPIDCGVWNNDRPVYPRGVCPICGRSVHFRAQRVPDSAP